MTFILIELPNGIALTVVGCGSRHGFVPPRMDVKGELFVLAKRESAVNAPSFALGLGGASAANVVLRVSL